MIEGETLIYECVCPNNSRFRIPATPPTKEGYSFVCWKDETGYIVHPGQMFTGGERNDFQAVWVENTKKMVIYDLNGSTGKFPTKEGYVFDCWEDTMHYEDENRREACIATAKVMLLSRYETAFVAGMLANIVFEGSTGQFESSMSLKSR